ncbi:hypothetical protein T07_14579 [Trichinella nelsoni]|uniref:Uncharacterized protein n=1 Tax=Trichinella nelsoni TaxID=6336 RepID=A0A0V0S727_9BILA|nr:hypothetical protein T07_14579 [Trichinella nelsoni]
MIEQRCLADDYRYDPSSVKKQILTNYSNYHWLLIVAISLVRPWYIVFKFRLFNFAFLMSCVSRLVILAGRRTYNSKTNLANNLTQPRNLMLNTADGILLNTFYVIQILKRFPTYKSASFLQIPRKCWTKNAINHEHLDISTVLPTSASTYFTTNSPTARNLMLNTADGILLITFYAIQILKRFPTYKSASFLQIPRKCWTKNAINHEHLDISTVLPTSASTYFTTSGPTRRINM